ncbi:hypothetical protein A3D68_00275 [Candidatus Adlerbacteria bacterium RIFCSPHIGHO2_02_FULL_52_17]|uniref:Uncharacterized protein n=1 Tax=Candidatus Adlerbacteria bacterium RIFCSPHIGHO2_02_FULL_52_17 TaxID=1797240 RepID=A0A1F4XMG3_9BACT|nr:MAG: hypothetical protein A3D68_00275 [Candidatus Adlerbacteria bacterium RIFCSPHIGHO2_02_FULL_52_17]
MQEPFDTTQGGQLDRMEVKLAELSGKLDSVHASAEKMRNYFLWTLWVTIGLIVVPLLILPLVLPAFLQSLVLPAGF